MRMPNPDSHITSGRYSRQEATFVCNECGNELEGIIETEYGGSTYTPEECPRCHGEIREKDDNAV
ncbi:unnamed protein product [marine sediment metagenome]|uniref:Uncharacterized protein n=1 Tax=marine sediment metagenome TaxID=412755 RepID=X1G4L1_9ZZZZ